jgi:hypothetical protein
VNDKRKRFDCLRLWAGIGVFHYTLALVGWSLCVRLLLRHGGDQAGWTYVGVRMIPCLLMLAGFVVATVLARRRRRFVKWLVSILTIVTFSWFGFDAYRHDYQIQATTDHGCEHYYVTWWWYNDRWDPSR